jgi:regulator of protease activity HflC (stomatin/prohibitin superfamily)
VTDDPGQYAATDAAPEPGFVQITEAVAGPLEAAEAIEQRDEQGRVPVVVRIHRQPPINPAWVLVAIGLGASGLFLPLFLALKAIVIVAAVVVLIVGLTSRLVMRIPPGTVGLTARSSRFDSVRPSGVHRVNPFLALTHVVTTRELAFDVPVAAVRSGDGVNVNVDLVLTLGIEDPQKFAYSITTGDLDEFIHATTQEAVRLLVRGIEALSALDLGADQAALLRASIDAKLSAYGVGVRNVAFTRVMLPDALTASLEARRLAAIQLSEEKETYALEERRMNDRASLIALEQESRHTALELESQAEELRLSKLDERLRAYPTAAHYDLELQRLKVAQQLAGNSRAVVSMGANDLVSSLLTAQQANSVASPPAPAPGTPSAPVTPRPAAEEAGSESGAPGRAAGRRRASG